METFTLQWWLKMYTEALQAHNDNMLASWATHGARTDTENSHAFFDSGKRYGDLASWISNRITEQYGEQNN